MECPDNKCDGSGFVFDDARRRAIPCSCRARRIAQRKARKLAGVIPKRFANVSFDRPPVTEIDPYVVNAVRDYTDRLAEKLSVGRGIWFYGPPGTGKTTLAMLISAAALRQNYSVAIYSLPRLLGMLRQSFSDDAGATLSELLDRLGAVDLLHIDDVGTEQSSEWVLEQLYTIINTRYEDQRSVMITTNLDVQPLRNQIGNRTVSRLIEMCGDPLPLLGADRRMQTDITLPQSSSPYDEQSGDRTYV